MLDYSFLVGIVWGLVCRYLLKVGGNRPFFYPILASIIFIILDLSADLSVYITYNLISPVKHFKY